MSTDSPKKAKSTVRNRKRKPMGSTQRFLPIGEIRNDTVWLKNGGLRAILQVEALNFNLKSETEQQGIISGYESFVNTLGFPLQIVIRSTKMNIDPYLVQLRTIASTQPNELLKDQTLAYADFIEKLIDIADIMQKKFYVVVPYDQNPRNKTMVEKFFAWMNPDDTLSKATQRHRDFSEGSRNLKERTNLIQTGLNNIGLSSKRLETHELIELYYQIFNPKTSQEQKLPGESDLKTEKTVL